MNIPKVELHVHLEGTVTPSLVKELAARHQMDIPSEIFASDTVFAWRDFLDFLKVYDVASSFVKTAEDYRDITFDYLKRCAEEGAIYVEISASPDHAANNGISYEDFLAGITQAIEDAEAQFEIICRIIIICVRHYGVELCEQAAELAANNPHPLVVGLGLGGDEAGFPAKQFAKTFQIAHEAGLACTAHAGEMAGPESVWEAIDNLPIKRVGHGVRSIEDPALIKELVARDIALEVCPTSNVALKVYKDYQSHPLLALRDAGLSLSLGSDDPPYFATTIGNEYHVAQHEFGLSSEELIDITRMAISSSFCDSHTKQRLEKKLP